MKAAQRIRKTAKWGGLILSIVLTAAWLASGFYVVVYTTRGGAMLELHAGRIRLTTPGAGPSVQIFPAGWHSMKNRGRYWPPPFRTQDVPLLGRSTSLALWPLAFLCFTATGASWFADIRARRQPHQCPRCHYDRAGLAADAVCPECGAAGQAARP